MCVAEPLLLTDIVDTRMAICPKADAFEARYEGNSAVGITWGGVVFLDLVHRPVVNRCPLG